MLARSNDSRRAELLVQSLFLVTVLITASAVQAEEASDAAYLKVVTARADKILAPLKIDDDARRSRVRDLIAQQYVALSRRQAEFEGRQKSTSKDSASDAEHRSIRAAIAQETDFELFTIHRAFVARLGAELSPEQVDAVKNGITYGVVPITYRRYLELLPELTAEQKAVVLANLLEAREYAMDAGSSEKKHAWFDKFKGRINNYLSSQGYNLKQAEQDWQAKHQKK